MISLMARTYCARYRLTHREKICAYRIAYYAAHREELNARLALYRRTHPEKAMANHAAYYRTHRDGERRRVAIYRAAHPQEILASNSAYRKTPKGRENGMRREQKRRALKWQQIQLAPERFLTPEQWETILELAKGRCYWCKRKAKLTQDHVIPLSKGGLHVAENIVAACQSCNSKKHTKILTLF